MIPIRNYVNSYIFDIEKNRYFSSNFCLGTVVGLENKGDYRTYNNFYIPITVRNVGKIKVFKNICLHRSALIDIAESGNSPFSCKYHGWAYSESGELSRTPLDPSVDRCNKKLETLPSKIIDQTIFLNSSEEFVAAFLAMQLQQPVIKSHCFFRGSLVHACNWKLIVENVLEPYHISFVHQDSFVAMGLSSTSEYEWGETGLGTYNRVTSRATPSKYYTHLDVSPNFFISDTNGYVTFLSYFIPVSVDQTVLHYELWESPELSRRPEYLKKKMREESISFTKKVLLEDKELVEAAQIGLRHATEGYSLSKVVEPRIFRFHENYLNLMK
jgi:phenylpropionate dioxygenase-like ring-hydroxylating dioxygenase large terminal subunit